MVQFCCVIGCGNRSNREYRRFFRLPTIPKPLDKSTAKAELIMRRRRQWLDNIARVDLKDGDSSYSSGYIRVCSDHFFTGKPSELTDVDNIDWAPILKMGKSRIRLKGNNVKKEMFGFSASERRRYKKLTKWTETNSMIQTIVQTTAKTDISEVEERRILALESQCVDNRKYYKPKKNPWGNKIRNISEKKKQLEEKSYFQRKTHIRMKQRQQRRKQDSTNVLFLKRKAQMRIKMSHLRMKRDQARQETLNRPVITIGHLKDYHPYKSPQFIKLENPVTVPLSTPSKSPLIHKITIDSGVLDKDVPTSNKRGESDFEIKSSVKCDKSLYKNIKSECDVQSVSNECDIQSQNEYGTRCDNQCESECNVLFGEEFNVQFENECNSQFESDCDFQTEDECGDESNPVGQCIAPSADENERILEMMNELFVEVKEEIKEEPL